MTVSLAGFLHCVFNSRTRPECVGTYNTLFLRLGFLLFHYTFRLPNLGENGRFSARKGLSLFLSLTRFFFLYLERNNFWTVSGTAQSSARPPWEGYRPTNRLPNNSEGEIIRTYRYSQPSKQRPPKLRRLGTSFFPCGLFC